MPGHDREAKREAQDANPLHKRLPAEIVSRRKRVDVAVEETAVTVTVDRKFVFVMTPEQRVRWLNKALKLGAEGLLRMSDIYDLITSSRFADSVPYKLGRKMDKALRGQLELFSAKQQRFLVTEAQILLKFGKIPRTSEHSASNAEIETACGATSGMAETDEGVEPRMEEMMARCRAFVREKMQERGEGNADVGGDGGGGVSGDGGEKEGVVASNAGNIALTGAGVEASKRLESDSESSCTRRKRREKEKSKDEEKTRERDKDKDKDKQRREPRKSRSRSRRKMIPRSVSSSRERRKRRKGRSTSSSSSAQTSPARGKVKDKKRVSSKRRARSSSESSSSSSGLARKRRREEDRRKKRRSPSSSESSRTRNRGKKKSRK
eukprot:TRINITY_DN61917_c0_g1_i1.p1 TRINITY_DN61917_c0_g1~~TRINITY_DN61917_c0_g1_i1.p1  ORF type:complete len:379 (-),score=66.85 TRINITY_DN61917_c0_g1_i1:123-1259(-)